MYEDLILLPEDEEILAGAGGCSATGCVIGCVGGCGGSCYASGGTMVYTAATFGEAASAVLLDLANF
jgi:hypothetical protein